MGYLLDTLLCRSTKIFNVLSRTPKVEGRGSVTRLNDEVKIVSKNNILIRYDVDLINEDIDELIKSVVLLKQEVAVINKSLALNVNDTI